MAELLAELLAQTDPMRQRELVAMHRTAIDDATVAGLKDAATQLLRSDVQRSLALAELLLHITDQTCQPHHRALGLLAKANALSLGGLGEYSLALELYNEAGSIYRTIGRPIEEANAQIAKILTLANLGRCDEALATGRRVAQVLEAHGEWLLLGRLTANLGNIHYRRGDDTAALVMFDRAHNLYQSLSENPEALKAIARVENNRSTVLRDLGRFEESMKASEVARSLLAQTGQAAEVARAGQNLAVTCFILGRYNDALALLGKALTFFLADGRQRDAILAELYISNCLLELHRFFDVLDKTRQARDLFTQYGSRFEVAQALLNEATAYAGLKRYDEALASLADARRTFAEEDHATWVASTDLEIAAVLHQLGRHTDSLANAQATMQVFHAHGLPVEEAQARLVAARAAIALGWYSEAAQQVTIALEIGEKNDLPSILYPCYHLLAMLAERQADLRKALAELAKAIDQLERLRRQLMIEHRSGFLEDKQAVYEDAVAVCLDLGLPERGLEYAERARSRALIELLDYRLEIGIEARSDEDRPLVDELVRLKAERDLVYRRWEGSKEIKVRGWTSPDGDQREVQQQVLAIEKRITALWHQLLVRNAAYASEAMFWQTRLEPIQPFVPPDILLLEYFVTRGQIIVFLVTQDSVQACRLPGKAVEMQRLMGLLRMNLKAAAERDPACAADLQANAQGLLKQLYAALLAPLADLPGRLLERYTRLVIVPYAWLHYVPFHALYDGRAYLAATNEISYLPGAGLLRHVAAPRPVGRQALALGLSYGGRLPHAPEEARCVARLLEGEVCLEEEATVDLLRERGEQVRVLHLATHGEFRPDNPLFSGLALSGAWLTTLDIFGLRLSASLVTLSACQTGLNVIGGGDELLGLSRAFLSAGAASLLISLWAVEDQSTAEFMQAFYDGVTQGQTKAAALQYAQRRFMERREYAHPYYWAPFVLLGHTGLL